MWSREILKARAKNALRGRYWIAFLVCLIAEVIGTGLAFTTGLGRNHSGGSLESLPSFGYLTPMSVFIIISILITVFFFAVIISSAYSFLVALPLAAGKSKFFLQNRNGEGEIGQLFYAFKSGRYIAIVKSMAWRLLFNALWFLLFIIPGIVKSYSYLLVPYILADNPNIGYRRALKLSIEMTDGYKFKIFILQLSFIGWYLLGSLCFFVGVLFVKPYYDATFAEMYVEIRDCAVESGICTREELNL
ncbi:MAG: DUF975 family protein [Bacillota bacterium]|nr:DUF975 family protein [Bacillota bacterium]